MDPQLVRLDRIQRYPANPKAHDLGAIHTSIHEFGFLERIVINRVTDHLLSGHGRIDDLWSDMRAQMIPPTNIVMDTDGMWMVPSDFVEVPEAKEGAAVIALNRTVELGGWDDQALVTLLQEIAAQDEALLAATGYDGDDLDALIAELYPIIPQDDPGPQLDRASELQQKWQVQTGDVWVIPSVNGKGVHRVMCGDSTNADDVARLMGRVKADIIITDPPYGVEYADKNKFLNAISPGNRIQIHIQNDHLGKEETQQMWKSAFAQMATVMREGSVDYCFMPPGGDQMMMMMMMGAGIEPRHELIWIKNNHVLGRVDYAYKHEPILYAWKGAGHKFYGDFQTSLIECDKPQKSDLHPTTKPLELVAKLLMNSSQKGEDLFDPFLGSGTTLVACEQTGRIGYGMEIDPAYVAVTLERLKGLGLEPIRA
jgi:DNA modification methylase